MHKICRIDQIARHFFATTKSVTEIFAKGLMLLFIQKGIFLRDQKEGLPVRKLLRELDMENELHLLKHIKEIRKDVNSRWYFKNASKY